MALIEQFGEGGGVTTQNARVKVVGATAREDDENITVDEFGEHGFLGGHWCVLVMICVGAKLTSEYQFGKAADRGCGGRDGSNDEMVRWR